MHKKKIKVHINFSRHIFFNFYHLKTFKNTKNSQRTDHFIYILNQTGHVFKLLYATRTVIVILHKNRLIMVEKWSNNVVNVILFQIKCSFHV